MFEYLDLAFHNATTLCGDVVLGGGTGATTGRQEELPVHADILKYNLEQAPEHSALCDLLARELDKALPSAESRIWHGHPVWFLDGNPIVGYSKQKPGIRLMFWSGADFEEEKRSVVGKKFKDASIFFNDVSEVPKRDLRRWLEKARIIQCDYKNVVRRKGRLVKMA